MYFNSHFEKANTIFKNIFNIDLELENDNYSEQENLSIIYSNKIFDKTDSNFMELDYDDGFNSHFFNSNIENDIKPTNSNTNNQPKRDLFIVKKEEEKSKIIRGPIPKIVSLSEINNTIKLYDISRELKLKFKFTNETYCREIEIIKEELGAQGFRTKKKLKKYIKLKEEVKHGRKEMKDNSFRSHNNKISDNLICKLINTLNKSLLEFINKIINILNTNKEINQILTELKLPKERIKQNNIEIIKKNDYNLRLSFMKIDKFIELLNYTLKQYFSLEISPKYNNITYPRKYNELFLNRLLKEVNNSNYQLFEFILNGLKISDYFDIFLHKKYLEDLNKYNSLAENQKEIIKNNIKRIEKYFCDEKVDKIYFHCLALVAYNLKRLLFMKEIRKPKKKI